MKRYIITAGKEQTALYNRTIALNVYRYYRNREKDVRLEVVEE